MIPSVLRKFFYDARGLEIVWSVTNPFRFWLPRFGVTTELSIRNDLTFRCNRLRYPVAKKLVWLSYYGARLGTTPAEGVWTVDFNQDRLSTPDGLSFTLSKIVDPFVMAETFVYEVHFAGFDLRGKTVVDVGANIGDTPLYYAAKGAKVFAYEPDPENFAILEENIARNPSLDISARPFAVGADGTVDFHVGLRGASGIDARGGRIVPRESRSLETILRSEGIEQAYLLKADCKGAEYDLVQQDAIGRFQRVLIEFDAPRRGHDLGFLLQELRRRGFQHLRVFKHNWWGPWRVSDHGTIDAER